MTKKIGFACKFSELHPTKGVIAIPEYNCKSTTIAWLNRQSSQAREEKLIDLAKHNIMSIKKVVDYLSTLPDELRMFRISSDVLSAYTHPEYTDFWQSTDVQNELSKMFAPIGETARDNKVRLSFHPDQFVVLASSRPEVVNKSIEEFEYHADMARFMGYGKRFQDFKINVHISGRAGPQGIRSALKQLTTEARNCITIENEEFSWGLDSTLELAEDLALVLDIHHHWIKTGEYIEASDSRIKRIIDSWRGMRPVIHYSVSREDYLIEHPRHILPNLQTLMNSNYKKQKLRAHSEFYWNDAVNQWALTHNEWADIMCESKAKNLASVELHKRGKIDV